MKEIELELLFGKKLIFIPYKGYFIIDADGDTHKLMSVEEMGPLKIVAEFPKHANCHTLFNLLDLAGNKIFDSDVRHIEFAKYGCCYVVEDNNEDDLINKYGCIKCDEYWEKQCVVLPNGKILTNKWYDKVSILPNNCVKVWKGDKENILNIDGTMYLEKFADYVTYFNGDYVCYIENNMIYKQYKDGKTCRVESLHDFSDTGEYYVSGGLHIKNGKVIDSRSNILDLHIESIHMICKITEDFENRPCNLFAMNAKTVFHKWYDNIAFSGIHGLYYIEQDGMWNIVDVTEKRLTDSSFARILPFYSGFAIVKHANGTYGIIDISGEIVACGFSSVLSIPHSGMWEVDFYSRGVRTFFSGEGGDFIYMVQGLLLMTQWVGLFEKNNIWYYLDDCLQMKPLLKYEFADGNIFER